MIDWAQVRQLQDDVGAEDMDEVVELFLDEVDEAMGTLETDYTTMGPDARSAAFHFLKGCASNLGFNVFAMHCGKGENITKTGGEPDFEIAELMQIYTASKTEFMVGKTTELN